MCTKGSDEKVQFQFNCSSDNSVRKGDKRASEKCRSGLFPCLTSAAGFQNIIVSSSHPQSPLNQGHWVLSAQSQAHVGEECGSHILVGDTQVRNEALDFTASNFSFLLLPDYQGMVLETRQQ